MGSVAPRLSLLLQPRVLEEHVQLVIECIPLHMVSMGLEVGGPTQIHPIEVFGQNPLQLMADASPLSQVHRSPPLPGELCRSLILQPPIVRGGVREEADRALVDIHEGGEILQGLLELVGRCREGSQSWRPSSRNRA